MFKVVLMGSPKEVIPVLYQLESLARNSDIEFLGVISQPARPAKRGQKLEDPPLAQLAKEKNIFCLQPEKASSPETIEYLNKLKPDIIITAAYGQILSRNFLKVARRAVINIHPSLLPKYRGATPVQSALLAGEITTGTSILFTEFKLDSGAIILQEKTDIIAHETSQELLPRLFELGASMLPRALKLLEDPNFSGTNQDESSATFCGKLSKEMSDINWNLSAVEIFNLYRGLAIWPGVRCKYGDLSVQLLKMSKNNLDSNKTLGEFAFDKSTKSIQVSCKTGILNIYELRPAGSKTLSAEQFWNGFVNKSKTYHFS